MSDATPDDTYPLAHLKGEPAPRSAWLTEALSLEPERATFECAGAAIELLTWGEIGKPGLLFLHGNGAHADWWRFIAPAFADEHRVAAISWSGMGGSEWRSSYSLHGYAQEIFGAIDAADLAASGETPILIGHSFGGVPLLKAAVERPDRIAGGILIDSMVRRPSERPSWLPSGKKPPVYASVADALARFRFAPLQPAGHVDIADFIARASLKQVTGGWTWRFDPDLWAGLDRAGTDTLLDEAPVPIALLFGEQSTLVDAAMIADACRRLPDCRATIGIPDAAHHVMVDQPVALIAAIREAAAGLSDTAAAPAGRGDSEREAARSTKARNESI